MHKLFLIPIVLLIPVLFALSFSFSDAQVANNQLNISAFVVDSEKGSISNGEYDIRFSIYTTDRTETDPFPSDSDSGKRVWQETQKISLRDGVLNAYLGSETPLPAALNFSNGEYYVGIRIGNDSEMIPRKKIGAVPTAINSSFLNGSKVGTAEGDIVQLGKGGKVDFKLLPTGSGNNQLVVGSDNRLHEQNTDLGTNSNSFVLGQGAGVAGNNFSLLVSGNSNNPAMRFNGAAGKWQLSNSDSAFGDILSLSPSLSGAGTGISPFAMGDMLYFGNDGLMPLGIGNQGDVLTVENGVPTWMPIIPNPKHNLLSDTHLDAETADAVRGDLITAQGVSTKWSRLAIGVSGSVLKSDGSDILWAALSKSDVGLSNVENTALSTWTGSTNLTTLGIITSGSWNGSMINTNYLTSNVMIEGERIGLLFNDSGYITASSTDTLTNKTWNGNAIGYAYGGLNSNVSAGNGLVKISGGATSFVADNSVNWNTAYTHSTIIGNPHGLTKTDLGIGNVENTALSTWSGSTNLTTLGTITTGTWNGSTISTTFGGTGLATYTAGDMLYYAAGTSFTKLAVGSNGQVLTVASGIPTWTSTAPASPHDLLSVQHSDSTAATALRGDLITAQGISPTWSRLALGANNTVLKSDGIDVVWSTLGKSDVGLSNVENTALSTWTGSTNLTTLGTIATGTWNGSAIDALHGGTGISSYTAGDMLYYSSGSNLSKLAVGLNGQVLIISSGVPTWTSSAPASPHNLLSVQHSDVTPGTAQRGDIITAQGISPTWSRLAIGTGGTVLKSNGTDAAWSTVSKSDVGLSNVENTALSTWTGSTNIATLGTVTIGSWNGSLINPSYLASNVMVEGENISLLTNNSGYITASSTDTLTNKTWSGNIIGYAYGGLNNDVSLGNGLIKISGGSTSFITDNSGDWNSAYFHSTIIGNPHGTTKTEVGLGSVENTALSTWAGSTNLTTLGTITTGTWNGTTVDVAHGGTGTTTQFTQGSVLFAGASGVYSQDNANLFWDDVNNRIGIGTINPSASLDILNSSSTNGLALNATTTLQNATGNQVAFQLNYTTNKATSGNDTGLLINMTDTVSPGTSNAIDIKYNGSSRLSFDPTVAGAGQLTTGYYSGLQYQGLFFAAQTNQTMSVGGSNNNTASDHIKAAYGTYSNSSGQFNAFAIKPIYNQSGTAGATDLFINRTQTVIGSGAQYLLDAQVDNVSKFSVNNGGQGYFAGNVGIGTATLGQKLSVAGNIQLTTGGYLYGDTTAQSLQLSSSSGSKLSYDANSYVSVGGNIIIFGNNPGEAMRILDGNVGIGTTNPGKKLEVAGDALFGINKWLTIEDTGGGNGRLIIGATGTIDTDNFYIRNKAGTTQRLIVNSSGNVGIGASSVGARLDVQGGAVRIGSGAVAAGAGDLSISRESAPASGYTYFGNTGTNYFGFDGTNFTFSPSKVLMTSFDLNSAYSTVTAGYRQIAAMYSTNAFGADVGAGLTFGGMYNASARTDFAQVAGLKENSTIDDYSGALTFSTRQNGITAFNERMRISSTGNVGIGTTNPGKKLEVAGDALFGINKWLTIEDMGGGGGRFVTNAFTSFDTTGNFYIRNNAGTIQRMVVDSSGNFGVGSASQFNVNSSGAITAATGITSSGIINFSGLTASQLVGTDASKNLVSLSTLGVNLGGTGTTTQFTQGSLLFAGASGVYSQNNANLFWDNTNNRLGIGTASPSQKLTVAGGSILTTPPSSPTRLGGIDNAAAGGIQAVQIVGKYAYIGTMNATVGAEDFQIYDISNPASPVRVGGVNVGTSYVYSVQVAGNYAYIGTSNATVGNEDFQIYDISNPASPTRVGGFNVSSGYAFRVQVIGRYAYIGTSDSIIGNEDFQIYDISNPASPTRVGGVGVGGSYVFSMQIVGKYAYIGTLNATVGGEDFQIYDISNPASITRVGGVDLVSAGNPVYSLQVSGKYAFVGLKDATVGSEDFQIYDISNPASPVRVSGVNVGANYVYSIQIAGNYAYIGTSDATVGTEDFQIYDISNPASPTRVGGVNSGANFVNAIGISGKYAYFGTWNASVGSEDFQAYDIGGVDSPQIATGFISANGLNISGDIYAANIRANNGANINGGLNVAGDTNFYATNTTFMGGNVGIGDTTPASMFTVGNGDLFQVNSSGAIASAAGITSSGTINFSGLTASQLVVTDASKNLVSLGTLGVNLGGTGAGTFSTNYLLKGNGTGAISSSMIFDNGSYISVAPNYTDTGSALLTLSPNQTITSNGTHTMYNIYSVPYMKINSGVTESGNISAGVFSTLRNASAFNDNGTANRIYGINVGYGHWNSDLAATPQTDNAYGITISMQGLTGTITNAYDIYMNADTMGGTVTNKWGIYQANTKNNYFAGNIGIGTASVGARLDILAASGSLAVMKLQSNSAVSGGYTLYTDAANSASRGVIGHGNSTWASGDITDFGIDSYGALLFGANNAEKMRILTSGNVGIGTTTPRTTLDVNGDIAVGQSYGIFVQKKNVHSDSFILQNAQYSSGVDTLKWITTHASYGSRGIRFNYGTGIHFYADNVATTADAEFTPTDRMIITNGGNVGIGAAAPVSRLVVNGTAGTDAFLQVTTAATGLAITDGLLMGMSTDTEGYIVNRESGALRFGSANAEVMRISGGNVGIGTIATLGAMLDIQIPNTTTVPLIIRSNDATPILKLGQYPTTSRAQLLIGGYNASSAPNYSFIDDPNTGFGGGIVADTLQFMTGGTEKMRIDSSGNVVIGATTATGWFDVATSSNSSATASAPYVKARNTLVTQGDGVTTYNFAGFESSAGNAFVRTILTSSYDTVYSGGSVGTATTHPFSIYTNGYANRRLTVDSAGNVGIGIVAPASKLNVSMSSALTTIDATNSVIFSNTDSTNNNISALWLGQANQVSVQGVGIAGIHTDHTVGSRDSDLALYTTQNNVVGERVRILNSGNVGIGTINPIAKLHVDRTGLDGAGPATIAILGSDAKTANDAMSLSFFALDSASADQEYGSLRYKIIDSLAGSEDSEIQLWNYQAGVSTQQMTIGSTGNVGIGDTTPTSLFTVGNGDLFQVNSSGAIAAVAGYTQGSGNFAISGAGTFGTGTGAISLNGATTIAGGKNLALASGIGTFAQTYTGTATAATIAADSLTSGNILSLTSASTAAAAGNTGLNIAISGANGTVAITRYGLKSAVTATNATSGTNIAGYFSASGATTANYGLYVAAGNARIDNGWLCVDNNASCSNVSPLAGTVYAVGAYTTGADYAEYFYTKDTDLKSGEAVCVDPNNDNAIKRCLNDGDNDIMGIVSSNPSIVGNKNHGDDPNYKIIGMIGQVAGLVSAENGPIKTGDSLTASIKPGYMRRANAGESTVGIAMQNLVSGNGTIQVLISRRNKSLTVEKVEQAVADNIANMNIQDQVNKFVDDAKATLATQISSQSTVLAAMQTQLDDLMVLSKKLELQMIDLEARINPELTNAKLDLDAQDIAFLKLLLGVGKVANPGDIEILGKLKAKILEGNKLVISIEDGSARTIGSAEILKVEVDADNNGIDDNTGSDGKKIKIKTTAVSANSRIFVTPKTATDQPLAVVDVKDAEGFSVSVKNSVNEDMPFDWFIVEEK